MFATLDGYQDQIGAIAQAAGALLDRAGPRDPAEILRLRQELARTMAAYQLFVHRQLFEPLARIGTPAEAGDARALKCGCILIAEEFRAFVRRWPVQEIAAQQEDHRAAGLDLVRQIRAHIDQVRGVAPSILSGGHPALMSADRAMSPSGCRPV